MDSGDCGDLGFWIFIAALVVGGMWKDARQKAEKHETLRRIVEKTGVVDEAKLKELFNPDEDGTSNPGDGYRALRITGTIAMFIGAGMAMFFVAMDRFSEIEGFITGLVVSACVTLVGLGTFFSSRFAEPPAGFRNDRPAP